MVSEPPIVSLNGRKKCIFHTILPIFSSFYEDYTTFFYKKDSTHFSNRKVPLLKPCSTGDIGHKDRKYFLSAALMLQCEINNALHNGTIK